MGRPLLSLPAVSVRTSRIAPDGCYPLLCCPSAYAKASADAQFCNCLRQAKLASVRTFLPINFKRIYGAIAQRITLKNYNKVFIISQSALFLNGEIFRALFFEKISPTQKFCKAGIYLKDDG